ncbi:baculoviral IAP repeat-containing protein 2-like [Pecten maximus]|uniref:baculoviral IAP repeat-containing protein 2-like n=1 Tax=Pecten maximus TaxID=6579 RepID=UPI001458856A|nr:baculoviral IAP repeat-containing protein 2-like [Pecten maximus]
MFEGSEDIVRCFCCGIELAEWNPDEDPWVEHARHSPECQYLKDQKGQDYINNIKAQWAEIYTPKHPAYTQVYKRRRTFRHENWPRNIVIQSNDQPAAAGFFYAGVGNTVRCHYCDRSLRDWEPADDPWVEHARWFPFCNFVLKMKGSGKILPRPVVPSVEPHFNERQRDFTQRHNGDGGRRTLEPGDVNTGSEPQVPVPPTSLTPAAPLVQALDDGDSIPPPGNTWTENDQEINLQDYVRVKLNPPH